MKRVTVLMVFVVLLLGGCASSSAKVRGLNRTALNRLSVGMTKDQVLATMGTQTYKANIGGGFAGGELITNPYRSETHLANDGETIEVLMYYTDVKNRDGAITDDELTPVVLKNSLLIGWGWSFWDQSIQKYEIRVR